MAIAIALMSALAGGAIWCLLSIYSGGNLAGFAFVIALFIVWILRANGFAGCGSGAWLAVLSVALASLYAFCLQAVVEVAAALGMPIRAAFARMDPGMAIDIAWVHLRGWNLLIIAGAAACAVAAMLRRPAAPRV